MLNYMLMAFELFFLQQYLQSASPAPLVTVGIVCGLACRNRVQDILRACSYLLFLLMTGAPFYHLFFFTGTILAFHWDTFFLTVYQKKKTVSPVRPIIHQTLRHTSPDAPQKSFVQTACANIGNGLLAMVNVYDKQSLWPVLGGMMLLSPLSLLVIVQKQEYPALFLPLAIYAILLCGSCFFFKHRIYTADKAPESHYYFSGRQMSILIPVAALFNSQAFYLLWRDGQFLALIPYICYIAAHLAHQLSRLIGYTSNGIIEETKFDPFPFWPPSWQTALGEFVRDRKEPFVLLGSYLNFGEVHNFFGWNTSKRFVDVYCRLSVTRLLEFIQLYGVTHIALTPASCFNTGFMDMHGNITSPLLHGVLQPLPQAAPNLHLYAVKHAHTKCPVKEFSA